MNETTINEAVHMSALVLANAGELGAAIIMKIAGNDISTAVNGSPLTRDMIQNLISRSIEKTVTARVKKARAGVTN